MEGSEMMRALLISLLLAGPAAAHSFYDPTCCSGRDCAPVADSVVTLTAKGWLVKIKPGDHPLAFKESTFLVPFGNFKIKQSPDEHFHVCLGEVSNTLFCIYVPGTGS